MSLGPQKSIFYVSVAKYHQRSSPSPYPSGNLVPVWNVCSSDGRHVDIISRESERNMPWRPHYVSVDTNGLQEPLHAVPSRDRVETCAPATRHSGAAAGSFTFAELSPGPGRDQTRRAAFSIHRPARLTRILYQSAADITAHEEDRQILANVSHLTNRGKPRHPQAINPKFSMFRC